MKIKQNYTGKAFYLLMLPFICLFGIQSAHAVQVSLGNMVTSNVYANPTGPAAWVYTNAFDNQSGTFEGYSVGGEAAVVTWDVNPLSRLTLESGQIVDKYIYSITLHSGLSSNYNLNKFSFSYSDGTTKTNITSFSNLSTNTGGTISPDANGLVTAEESNAMAQHTVTFDVSSDIKSITLNIPTGAGQNATDNDNWVLSEVTGTVSAEVVPEPSTYALIAGLIAFTCVAYRKKRIKA